ncbi:MAG: hypothetical protein SP1CHLAM54_10960 [Chlamydiia bacterium]|nr:hypothetical protein [Chlamydiia bacterium]MCH9616001.1 hypothetical protein [Chlamydiia bacterium]MCH9629024.1 hypothetical protein [Chlamydiia bacterium]
MSQDMNYWLMKSEPNTYSIDDLKIDKKTHWDGVRNYQARNFMRDQMKVGDTVLFYHSNAKPPGIIGLATVASEPYSDHTAGTDHPWVMVDVAFQKKFPRLLSLDELKTIKGLEEMLLLRKGQRLSIQPVTKKEYQIILKLSEQGEG